MKRKLFLLSLFYFVQGLPYGFQLVALPIYLRSQGMSLAGIGLASVVSLPWVLKILWGPAVDRYGSRRFGRRRSWILPLQACLAMTCLIAASVQPTESIHLMLGLALLMNACAATMDVAVDGLAVDLLENHELGYGNISQVVGYKVGILFGGGVLVWATAWIGWQGLFLVMAGLVTLVLAIASKMPERPPEEAATATTEPPLLSFNEIFQKLWQAMRLPGSVWLLLFIGSYKIGEAMADTMFKPFLYDAGFDAQQIGLWIGTWGTLFSLTGSFAGGILASRRGVLPALTVTAILRAAAVGGEWWLSLVEPTAAKVIAVTAGEQFFGGALTTALFAFMMSRVDRRIGATHFTLLATVEVFGKLASGSLSGLVVDATSYTTTFALATILAVAFLILLWPIWRTAEASRGLQGSQDPEMVRAGTTR